jgi:chromosome segregation ATPase
MAKDPVKELEAALEREKQERSDAEKRAARANGRAQEADEAYRKLQLALVAAKDDASMAWDEAKKIQEKLAALQQDVKALREAAPPAPRAAATAPNEAFAQVEHMLQRIEGLREMLAAASNELSQLHADEVALGKKRSRVLTDACAILARAVGATGQAPPPIPSAALEARLSMAPVVDISEVADLIESLRPPRTPQVE